MNRAFRFVTMCSAACCLMALTVVTHAGQAKPPSGTDPKTLKSPVRADADAIERGSQVYFKYCRHCHGNEAKGDGLQAPEGSHPANLIDDRWDHGATDGEVFTTIRNGVGPKFDMTPYEGKIPDEDIWKVVLYLRSIGPKPAAASKARANVPAKPSGR